MSLSAIVDHHDDTRAEEADLCNVLTRNTLEIGKIECVIMEIGVYLNFDI